MDETDELSLRAISSEAANENLNANLPSKSREEGELSSSDIGDVLSPEPLSHTIFQLLDFLFFFLILNFLFVDLCFSLRDFANFSL